MVPKTQSGGSLLSETSNSDNYELWYCGIVDFDPFVYFDPKMGKIHKIKVPHFGGK